MSNLEEERRAAQALHSGNYEEAFKLLRPLAEASSPYALMSLGWLHETGSVGEPDAQAARLNYESAIVQGSVLAYFYLGRLLLREGDDEEGRLALQAGAKLGDEQCVVELARLSDIDAEERAAKALKDGAFEEAEKILKPLAERNSEYALLSLGWVYETGVLGVPDLETARSYYESAVAQGSSSACFELGRMSRGQGKEAEARSAFAKGAERGDVPSMSRLGRMMVEGKGGPADAREGAVWLERAAAEGHILAQRTLLGIEEKSASSLLEKLAVKRKIVSLMKRGAQEFLKDAQSDKVR